MYLSETELMSTINKVAFSIKVALSPTSKPDERQAAHKIWENFRESTNPVELTTAGFFLVSSTNEPELIITGLQFIEHVIKFHWVQFQGKDEVKERLCSIMQNGFPQILPVTCPSYLQEALAKVIVEIGKREWPQLWPNLFPRLCDLAATSDIPLLVLRRFAEDVITLQTVDCMTRRRELSQSLNAISAEVISTLYRVLVDSVRQFEATKSPIYQRRAKVALESLLPYIEWLNPTWFLQENRIPILFALLRDPSFNMEAADCILQLLERKVKKDDRCALSQACLTPDTFTPFLESICQCPGHNTDFLRKLGVILTCIGSFLFLGKAGVDNFLKCTAAMAYRNEAVSVLGSAHATNHFLRNIEKTDEMSDPIFNKNLLELLNLILKKVVSKAPDVLEKDDMVHLKSEFSQMLRTVGKIEHKLYGVVNTWLYNCLSSPSAVEMFQWETLVLVLDSVASSVSQDDDDIIKVGLRDLELCLSRFNAETNLELKSVILSGVSALFVFLSLSKQRGEFADDHLKLLLAVIQSLFKCYLYDESERNIRRHATSLLIKLGSKFPDVLAPSFDYIHSSASSLAPRLTTMEHHGLIEAMLLISNSWEDETRQSSFIWSILHTNEWQEISLIIRNPVTFMETLQERIFAQKKPLIVRNLSILYSVLRRVKPKKLKASSVEKDIHTEAGPLSTHPAYDHTRPLIPIVLEFVKTIHSLVENPSLKFVMDLNEGEKTQILGMATMGDSSSFMSAAAALTGAYSGTATLSELEVNDKSHSERVKIFIQSVQDMAYGILGECSILFPVKFYSIPHLGDAYLNFVGWNGHLMSDFRVRGFLRSVFKPFLLSCPLAQVQTILKPFIQNFGPFMSERLVGKWTSIESLDQSPDGEEKEVLENSSLRLLTKEYLELIQRILERSYGTESNLSLSQSSMEGNQMDMDGTDGTSQNGNSSRKNSGSNGSSHHAQATVNDLGDVGRMLLEDPICLKAIVHLSAAALCWEDSLVCLRAGRCLILSWTFWSQQPEVVHGVFANSLRGICHWAENDASFDAIQRLVDIIFLNFHENDPLISQMMVGWGAREVEIKRMAEFCHNVKNDKKRKDLFRKLVQTNPFLEKNKKLKSQWLSGLPKLIIHNEAKLGRNRAEIDLNECFSVLHD